MKLRKVECGKTNPLSNRVNIYQSFVVVQSVCLGGEIIKHDLSAR